MPKDTNNTALAPTLKEQVANLAISEKTGLQIARVGEAWAFSELLARSGMLPKNTTVEGATVAMVAGARLGLDPFQSVQGIASINGRPAIWGDAMVAVAKNSGKLEWIRKEAVTGKTADDAGIRVTVKRVDEDEPYVEVFTVADAKRAGLWNKPGPWQQYPRRMLFSRARAFALRDAFADVLRGFRSVEEEQDTPPAAPAEPRDITAEVRVETPARRHPARTLAELAAPPPQRQDAHVEIPPPAETPATKDAPAEAQEPPPADFALEQEEADVENR